MILRTCATGAAIWLCVLSTPAHGGTRLGQFAIEEAGGASCSAFLKARATKSRDLSRFLGFIEGYMTAANRYEVDTFDLTPWHNQVAFELILAQHCAKHPKDTLVMATQKLVIAMKPMRLTEYSNLIVVGSGQLRSTIYESVLKRAQVELAKKGLYRGPANGRYSSEMKLALQAYQKNARLSPNGLPDTATLWMLLNP